MFGIPELRIAAGRVGWAIFYAWCCLLVQGTANSALASPPLGAVLTDLGNNDGARSVAIQGDGKIVAAGFKYGPSGFALARYHADGRLDPSFGNGGIVVTTDFFGDNPEAMDVAIHPVNGKIIVAGFAGGSLSFAVARYHPNGMLDDSFGTNGKVVTNLTGDFDYDLAYTVVLQGDKIILGGFCNCISSHDFTLVRYDEFGNLDGSFGSGGVVLTDFNNGSDDRINVLMIDSNGDIVAGGRSDGNFALARYSGVDGRLDNGFGTNGLVTTDFGGSFEDLRGLGLAGTKIVAAGLAGPGRDIGLARYSNTGTLDRKFGNNGTVLADMGTTNDITSALIVQSDGKLVVGGYAQSFFLARFTSVGVLDNAFDTDGKVYTNLGGNGDFTRTLGLALQGDGQIVAAGQGNEEFALARYDMNGFLDSTFGPRADVAVTLTDSPDPVRIGNNITYTMTIANNGMEPAFKVRTGGIPTGTAFVSMTATQGSCSQSGCDLGTLNPGASATVTLVVAVNATGSISHSMTATSITADPDPANDTASTTTTVEGSADLSVAMTVSPAAGKIRENITYSITVTNYGPDTAANVTVVDTLPNDVAYRGTVISATSGQGPCSWSFATVTCNLGNVPGATSVPVTIVVQSYGNATLVNSVTVSGVGDPDSANNSASVTSTVESVADLAITMTASANPVRVGQNLTYTMRIVNQGPDAAYDVAVRTENLWRLYYASHTTTQGTCSYYGSGLVCQLNSILPGGTATVTLTVYAEETRAYTLTSAIEASAYGYGLPTDPDPANNSASVTLTAIGEADLAVTGISDSPDPVNVENNLTYTVTVTNRGPDPAFGLRLAYDVPFSRVSGDSGSGCVGPTSGSGCQRLDVGGVWTATYTIQPQETGTIPGTATVSSNIPDPDGSNNGMTTTTTITGSADLSITMADSPDPVRINNDLTYSIAVRNNGADGAWKIRVTDTLPAGVTFLSYFTRDGSCVENVGTVTCDFYFLSSGYTATVDLVVRVNVKGTTLSNTASVTNGVNDPNTSNNSATVTTTVR